ncbi:F-box only protein 34 [Labrus mixtus]|uniref:F-box only protein 34 n=1 Tax=Labrus mixtus TaxID=508554 RepID=UPI0029C00A60|nr:F-box only protein 34 [Labrus mixtus]
MHLKSCPKLVRSELRLDASGVQHSSLFVSQQGALLRTYSSNHGNSNRLPLNVISTNTLRCSNTNNHSVSTSVSSLRLKVSPNTPLQLLPPLACLENDTSRLYQTTPEVAEPSLDIWTVIKPGHVREKIAIFASDGHRTDSAGGSECTSTSRSDSGDRTPSVSHAPSSGLLRALKAKGSWEENSSAKRRRRSGNNTNTQQGKRTRVPNAEQPALKTTPWQPDLNQQLSVGRQAVEAVSEAEVEEQKVSVGEMVAFLEQRASEQQPDSKPVLALQRSSASITLSRAPPPEFGDSSEVRGEEPESVKVSDMVAKLESECLKRRTEGDLSRSNSLRRTVGRVLLTTGDQSEPASPSSVRSSLTSSSSSLSGAQPICREPISCSETSPASALSPPSPSCQATPPPGETGLEAQTESGTQRVALTQPTPPWCEEAEPLPGLLFLSAAASETCPPQDLAPSPPDSEPQPTRCRMTCEFEPCPLAPSSDSSSQSERRMRPSESVQEEQVVTLTSCYSVVVPLGRRVCVSHDFLLMRQRLQQLLEPQPYLSVLPHHLLVKIFLLLPTQSLAALKCTCHYFHFIIETYGVRPSDSLWVSDPRYRDDPCKQCKKRYGRGDVSLCRWHHKPYCQALPYGPGYWMCCHGSHRDAPGCNVGLHDNRWVPAFHSINVPIYRRSCLDN